jgi:hypothetical protein
VTGGLTFTGAAARTVSGTSPVRGVLFDFGGAAAGGFSASGAGNAAPLRGLEVLYNVAQSNGANGVVTGILVNATETAVLGAHNLLDLQNGGASKFKVNSGGYVTMAANTNLTCSNYYALINSALSQFGYAANAASARAVKTANFAGLTSGNDRFVHSWYNDSGATVLVAELTSAGALALGGAGSFGNVVGPVLYLKDVTTEPTGTATGGCMIYSFGGVLKKFTAAGVGVL